MLFRSHILYLTVSHRPVFLLNSCLSLFSATYLRRHPFSQSYGVNLPSSLTVILPPALGFSPHLPVSVCGTGTTSLSRRFSWKHEIRYFSSVEPSPSRPRIVKADLPALTPSTLRPASNSWHILSFSVTPSIITIVVVLEYQPIVHRLRLSASP